MPNSVAACSVVACASRPDRPSSIAGRRRPGSFRFLVPRRLFLQPRSQRPNPAREFFSFRTRKLDARGQPRGKVHLRPRFLQQNRSLFCIRGARNPGQQRRRQIDLGPHEANSRLICSPPQLIYRFHAPAHSFSHPTALHSPWADPFTSQTLLPETDRPAPALAGNRPLPQDSSRRAARLQGQPPFRAQPRHPSSRQIRSRRRRRRLPLRLELLKAAGQAPALLFPLRIRKWTG